MGRRNAIVQAAAAALCSLVAGAAMAAGWSNLGTSNFPADCFQCGTGNDVAVYWDFNSPFIGDSWFDPCGCVVAGADRSGTAVSSPTLAGGYFVLIGADQAYYTFDHAAVLDAGLNAAATIWIRFRLTDHSSSLTSAAVLFTYVSSEFGSTSKMQVQLRTDGSGPRWWVKRWSGSGGLLQQIYSLGATVDDTWYIVKVRAGENHSGANDLSITIYSDGTSNPLSQVNNRSTSSGTWTDWSTGETMLASIGSTTDNGTMTDDYEMDWVLVETVVNSTADCPLFE